MQIPFLPKRRRLLAGALAAVSAFAVETRVWQQCEKADFEKAKLERISLRSDGRLSLAPRFREVYDAAAGYLWALAEDSKGRLYAGGGSPGGKAKLFVIESGKGRLLAELEELEIHALAVNRKDDLFAATSPDGKVYRVSAGGKAEVFYDPKAKYIWAMVFDGAGNLYLATGDKGEIHRVTPNGQGAVFFQTEETHARSLAADAKGNVIVGTEPGGLVFRVTPAGEGYVLYQAPKREVTAVSVAADGSIYAAAVGNKQPAAAPLPLAPAPAPAPAPTAPGGAAGQITVRAQAVPMPPPSFAPAPSVSGGSEVYRIAPDGYAKRVWSHAQEVVYALALEPSGKMLIGGGNNGRIYRLEDDNLYTLLVSSTSTQITAFHPSARNGVFVATANVSRIYQLGPGLESEGTVESESFDAGGFAAWGRLHYQGSEQGGRIAFESRSGNLDRPQRNWSPWAAVPLTEAAGRVASPAARFLQYRLKMTASAAGTSPEVASVETAYLPRNAAPTIEEIEATPPNYRFPAQQLTLTPSQTLTLPAMGSPRRAAPSLSLDTASLTMNYAKGWVGARWLASDENGDPLVYKVEIRGARETAWKLLKDKVKERHYNWDSTAFPDGEYRLRITVTDAPGNPPGQALESSRVSEPVWVDNTPPVIEGLSATIAGGKIAVRFAAKDAISVIEKAEYSVNGGEWLLVEPTTRLADSLEHAYEFAVDRPAGTGEAVIAVRAADEYDNQSVAKAVVPLPAARTN